MLSLAVTAAFDQRAKPYIHGTARVFPGTITAYRGTAPNIRGTAPVVPGTEPSVPRTKPSVPGTEALVPRNITTLSRPAPTANPPNPSIHSPKHEKSRPAATERPFMSAPPRPNNSISAICSRRPAAAPALAGRGLAAVNCQRSAVRGQRSALGRSLERARGRGVRGVGVA